MLVTCWSVKGGSGTTVVAASLALLAAASPPHALLVDLGGDAPAVLGLPEPSGPGLGGWLRAGPDAGAAALGRLEIPVVPGLSLLASGDLATDMRTADLAALLGRDERFVVVDAGGATTSVGRELASGSTVSLLVLRPCYLALRRAVAAPLRPSGVVLVAEPMRALGRKDVQDVLGVPVVGEVPYDPVVARAVDAGLLASRLPTVLARGLRRAA